MVLRPAKACPSGGLEWQTRMTLNYARIRMRPQVACKTFSHNEMRKLMNARGNFKIGRLCGKMFCLVRACLNLRRHRQVRRPPPESAALFLQDEELTAELFADRWC